MPLLLELSQPVKISSSRQDMLKEEFDMVGIKYNPLTQVKEDSKGFPQFTETAVETKVIDGISGSDSGIIHDNGDVW